MFADSTVHIIWNTWELYGKALYKTYTQGLYYTCTYKVLHKRENTMVLGDQLAGCYGTHSGRNYVHFSVH